MGPGRSGASPSFARGRVTAAARSPELADPLTTLRLPSATRASRDPLLSRLPSPLGGPYAPCSSSSPQPTTTDSCATACASSCFSKTGRWGHKTLPRTPLLFRFATPKNHPSAYPVIDAITACEWKKTRRGGTSGLVVVCFVGVVSGLLHTRGKTLVAALTEIDRQLRPDFSSLNRVTTNPRSVGTVSLCTANFGTKPMSKFAFIPFSRSIVIDGELGA